MTEFREITPECRANRGDYPAYDQAAHDLWHVYGVLLSRHPDATFVLTLARKLPQTSAAGVAPTADQAERRDRYAAALREHYLSDQTDEADADGNMPCRCGDWREPGPMGSDEDDWDSHLADAVMAVADTEQAELRAEVERLGDWIRSVAARAEKAEADRDRWHDELAVNEKDRVAAVQRAERAEAAVDRATILRAAADELDRYVGLQSSDAAPEVEGARLVIRELRRMAATTAPPAAVPAVDQTALRQQVIDVLLEARRPGLGAMTEADAVAYMADAVLAVFPGPDRARAVAPAGDDDCERCEGSGLDPDAYFQRGDTWTHAPCSECQPEDDETALRRLADEAQPAAELRRVAGGEQHTNTQTADADAAPEHVDGCPGCIAFTPGGHIAASAPDTEA